jgi:hypothetical protein
MAYRKLNRHMVERRHLKPQNSNGCWRRPTAVCL